MTKRNTNQAERASARIRELMDSLEMNPTEFSRYIGLRSGQPQVRRWAAGEDVPSAKNAALIASKGNGDPAYYQGLDTPSERASSSASKTTPVPYGGALQAGVWRESVEQDFDEGSVFPLPYHIAKPWRDLRWFEVRGESMNLKYEPGTTVIAASIFTNPIEPTNGSDVIVQRKSVDGTYESTIKEFMRDSNGKTWLVPRSTEPEFQAPIDLAQGNHEDEDVVITGIVVYEFKSTYHPLPGGIRKGGGKSLAKIDDIMARHAKGESHASIGSDYNISRERVRQIVASMGGVPRAKQRKKRDEHIREAARPKDK